MEVPGPLLTQITIAVFGTITSALSGIGVMVSKENRETLKEVARQVAAINGRTKVLEDFKARTERAEDRQHREES